MGIGKCIFGTFLVKSASSPDHYESLCSSVPIILELSSNIFPSPLVSRSHLSPAVFCGSLSSPKISFWSKWPQSYIHLKSFLIHSFPKYVFQPLPTPMFLRSFAQFLMFSTSHGPKYVALSLYSPSPPVYRKRPPVHMFPVPVLPSHDVPKLKEYVWNLCTQEHIVFYYV